MQMRLPAQTTDAELLARLHAQCFVDAWSADSFAALLAQPTTFAIGAGDGFIVVRVAGGESELLTLGIIPAARRRGAASALLRAGLEEAGRRGAAVMFLEVGSRNFPAIALYKRHGFAQVATRKSYYAGSGGTPEDALVFRADIPPVPVGKGLQLG